MSRFPLLAIAFFTSALPAGAASAQMARDSSSVPHAYTGIGLSFSARFNPDNPREKPQLLYVVPDIVIKHSPADSAGVQVGDTIIEVNGQDVRDFSAGHPNPLGRVKVGETFVLRLRRNGVEREVVVTAAPRPQGLPPLKELRARQKRKQ